MVHPSEGERRCLTICGESEGTVKEGAYEEAGRIICGGGCKGGVDGDGAGESKDTLDADGGY